MASLSYDEHEIDTASTADAALKHLSTSKPDLIILDLSLPDQNGLNLCARIQSSNDLRDIPVIILTANADVQTKVAAFSLGVEDYVVKPFDLLEFRARVEAKLKKIQKHKQRDEVVTRGQLQLNLSRQKAYDTNSNPPKDLGLSPLEFKLLYQLTRHDEQILSRNRLLDLVWGDSTEVLDRTVDAHISVLRKKLGTLSSHIESIAGEGYRFTLDKKHRT